MKELVSAWESNTRFEVPVGTTWCELKIMNKEVDMEGQAEDPGRRIGILSPAGWMEARTEGRLSRENWRRALTLCAEQKRREPWTGVSGEKQTAT